MMVAAATERLEHSMFERRLHALIVGSVLLVAAAVMAIIIVIDPSTSPLQGIDDRWLKWMISIRTGWLTRLAKMLSFAGSVKVTLPLRVLVAGLLAWHRRWLQLAAFVGAVITSELCIGPLKSVIDRPRPPGPLIGTGGAAFPSGHAIAGAVTAFGLVVVVLPASPRRWIAIGLAAAFAGLMAISRTYLAAHWLTDTIAGVCIGTGLALVWPAALELARDRRRRTASASRPSPSYSGGDT
jgi:undecaprenyl-diphosphatase